MAMIGHQFAARVMIYESSREPCFPSLVYMTHLQHNYSEVNSVRSKHLCCVCLRSTGALQTVLYAKSLRQVRQRPKK